MSKKAARKGKRAPSRQQQQQDAAARRQALAAPGGLTAPARPAAAVPARPAASASAAPETRHYLDVSAVRIQDWLGRTPDLRFRRGASIMLSEATGRDAWPDMRLPSGMRWNTEAGDLDGVVSMVVDDTVAAPDVPGCLAAASQVAAELRRRLPFCPVQAVAGSGDGYADAYQEIERARRDGDFLVDSPPAPVELILAKPCDQCRAAPAEHPKVQIVSGEEEDLCGECLVRATAAGGTKGDRSDRSPRPERRMKDALAAAGMAVKGFPDNFRDMAAVGRRDSDDAATQLALIYADGNRVGAFVSEAAAHARSHVGVAKSDIVRVLDAATLAALADAVIECFSASERPPILAHLAGGDDLMVSVPATYAWPFVRALLAAFGSRMASAANWPAPVGALLPSLSAGIVFHHLTAPFPDIVRLAKHQLDEAKRSTLGKAPSLAFLDLTADGGKVPAARSPQPLADLDQRAGLLDSIALVPRSHRQTLAALHRLCAEHGGTGMDADRSETPAEALARRVVDLGHRPLWEAVAGPGADAPGVRSALVSDPGVRDELRRVLDLARWWPPPRDAAGLDVTVTGARHREVSPA